MLDFAKAVGLLIVLVVKKLWANPLLGFIAISALVFTLATAYSYYFAPHEYIENLVLVALRTLALICAVGGVIKLAGRHFALMMSQSLRLSAINELLENIKLFRVTIDKLRTGDPETCDFYAKLYESQPVSKGEQLGSLLGAFAEDEEVTLRRAIGAEGMMVPLPTIDDLVHDELLAEQRVFADRRAKIREDAKARIHAALTARDSAGYAPLIDLLDNVRGALEASLAEQKESWAKLYGSDTLPSPTLQPEGA